MSKKYPIISITGSSGAGTTTVKLAFEHIFRREKINAMIVEGDSFHRYDRLTMKQKIADEKAKGNSNFTHFGAEANLLSELQDLFKNFSENGTGKIRKYLHNEEEAAPYHQDPGTFTPWEDIPKETELLFYEGLHGGVVHKNINLPSYLDLLIGVVPSINLEWIQKLHRDKISRGYSQEAVVDTILTRMPDYINYICPQFTQTDINFQRIPIVDTSNPFIAREIPTADESMVVIRFKNPRGIDFPYLISMINNSWMTRPNSLVIPGGKLSLAMELIFTPIFWRIKQEQQKQL